MKSISPDDKGEITMVKILAGEKGEGKTKKMIAMANEAGKTASGSIVFVDDDNSHMYDLHYSVRFVDTPEFIMQDPQVFRGFVCGILSQNSDHRERYHRRRRIHLFLSSDKTGKAFYNEVTPKS